MPIDRILSSANAGRVAGFSSALVSWYRNVLLADPPPLAMNSSSYSPPGSAYSSICAGRFDPVFFSVNMSRGAICE